VPPAHPPDARTGAHQGACVVANGDGCLDYLDRTVDVAVGLARAGQAGEMIASLDACRAVGVMSQLQTAGLRLDDTATRLATVSP
jgi:hypothetical protein